MGLIELPGPRVAALVGRIEELQTGPRRVGAVVAYGSRFVGRGAHTVNTVPAPRRFRVQTRGRRGLGCHARVAGGGRRRGAPRPGLVLRARGLRFLLPAPPGRVRTAGRCRHRPCRGPSQTAGGRLDAFRAHRPTDRDEAWRAYYHARNSVELTRRHGRPSWHLWYLLYTARQLQRATGADHRKAIAHGAVGRGPGPNGREPALHPPGRRVRTRRRVRAVRVRSGSRPGPVVTPLPVRRLGR